VGGGLIALNWNGCGRAVVGSELCSLRILGRPTRNPIFHWTRCTSPLYWV